MGYGKVELSVEEERRQHPRAIAHWPVILENTEGMVTGVTMDISAGGAFICCRESLKEKERFSIAFHNVPLLDHSLSAEVEVVRSNIYCMDDELMSYGTGVRFSKISKEDREVVTTLVSDHLEPKDVSRTEGSGSQKIIS